MPLRGQSAGVSKLYLVARFMTCYNHSFWSRGTYLPESAPSETTEFIGVFETGVDDAQHPAETRGGEIGQLRPAHCHWMPYPL